MNGCMPDPQNTPSLADDIGLLVVKGIFALATLTALVFLPLLTPESYATGIVTGALAPVLLLAGKSLYDETSTARLARARGPRPPGP